MKKRPSRAVSPIVATVLLVLLVVTSVLIVWLIIKQEMQKQEKEIRAEPYSISLSIVAFSYNETSKTAWISIRRGNDKAELAGIKFVLENSEEGESCSIEKTQDLPEPLETKTFTLDTSCMPNFNILSIYPMLLIGTQIKIGPKQDEIYKRADIGGGGGASWGGSGGSSVTDVPPEAREPLVLYIDSCQELNRSGVVYKLTKDIIGPSSSLCINITGKNIIFDCQGHLISGDPQPGQSTNFNGIAIWHERNPQVTNITIKNCTLMYWVTFALGAHGASKNKFENLNITLNPGTGIDLYNSSENIIVNSIIEKNNGNGISLIKGEKNLIKDTMITNNGKVNENYYDIKISSSNSTLTNLTIRNIFGKGIYLEDASNNLINKINMSGGAIKIVRSHKNNLTNISITSSPDPAGIMIYGGSNGNILKNVSIANPSNNGIHIGDSQDTIVSSCKVLNAQSVGVHVVTGAGAVSIINTTVCESGVIDFWCDGSTPTSFEANTCNSVNGCGTCKFSC